MMEEIQAPDSLIKKLGVTTLKLVGYILLTVLIIAILVLPLSLLVNRANASMEGGLDTMDPGFLTLIWTIFLTGAGGAAYVFCRFVDKKPLSWIGIRFERWWQSLLLGAGWGAALPTVGFIVLLIFGWLKITGVNWSVSEILIWAVFFFIAAAFEEVLFRGYILNMVSENFNIKAGLIVSSILFGLVHLSNLNVSFIGILNIILAGFVLGVAYLFSKNLWMPTALHFAWNYFQGTIFGFEVSGNPTYALLSQQLSGPDWLTGGDFGFEGSAISVVVLLVFLWIYRKELTAR